MNDPQKSEQDFLDGYLDEVLGGESPPDLKDRILSAWEERQSAGKQASSEDVVFPQPNLTQPILTQSIQTQPESSGVRPTEVTPPPPATSGVQIRTTSQSRPSRNKGMWWVVAASLLIAIVASSILFVNPPDNGTITENDRPAQVNQEDDNSSANHDSSDEGEVSPRSPLDDDDSDLGPPPEFGPKNDSPSLDPGINVAQEYSTTSDEEVVAMIDDMLRKKWNEHNVEPSAKATDSEWARRTYIRMLGRIPSVDELMAFVNNSSPDKREKLIDDLMGSDRYAKQYAENWADIWTIALIGRTDTSETGSRVGLVDYLQESFADNVRFDQLAKELITARGSNNPTSDDYNGATNFLLSSLGEKGTLVTDRVCRVFMGQRLQCAQCHDHPFDDKSQLQYWQMNAFFRQLAAEEDGDRHRLVDRDFLGESQDGDGEIFFERPNGELKTAYPAFVGNDQESVTSGLINDMVRRERFADRLLASEDFSRTVVNRIWGHFFGYGFSNPIDDMGHHNPPSHPELIDSLAKEFRGHGYDIKRLIGWIAESEAFTLSSKMNGSEDNPQAGTVALFSHYYARPMQPEEVYRSLQLLARGTDRGPMSRLGDRQAWLGQFVKSLGTDEGSEIVTFDGGIPQSLSMMNGPLTVELIRKDGGSFLNRLVENEAVRGREKISHMFHAAYSRDPFAHEMEAAELLWRQKPSIDTLQDLWWVLLNSSEFIIDR